MAKKQVGVSLRKPPPAADLDSFVADGAGGLSAEAITKAADGTSPALPGRGPHQNAVTTAPRQEVVLTAHDGERVREMTVYLPEDLARRLAMHCREKDRDASKLVAEAIAAHIEPSSKIEPAKITAPAKKPMRIEIPWAKWQKQFETWRSRFFPTRAYR